MSKVDKLKSHIEINNHEIWVSKSMILWQDLFVCDYLLDFCVWLLDLFLLPLGGPI